MNEHLVGSNWKCGKPPPKAILRSREAMSWAQAELGAESLASYMLALVAVEKLSHVVPSLEELRADIEKLRQRIKTAHAIEGAGGGRGRAQ